MAMRSDFCAFILSHGRPDRVVTWNTMRKAGYTGRMFVVIDDEDNTADQYQARYGDDVIQFCKADVAALTDEGDNFGHRKSTIYARNVFHSLARERGFRYFIQLDDDYNGFYIRANSNMQCVSGRIVCRMDDVLSTMLDYYTSIPATSLAMSQGGDHIGGGAHSDCVLKRKCMNSFICDVERPLQFVGHLNEDVNTYVTGGLRGDLFFTSMQVQLNQAQTQANAGGMSDIYHAQGTYVKSFYTVMYAPSACQIGVIGDHRSPHFRIHHKLNWNNIAPKILRNEHRKHRRDKQEAAL